MPDSQSLTLMSQTPNFRICGMDNMSAPAELAADYLADFSVKYLNKL